MINGEANGDPLPDNMFALGYKTGVLIYYRLNNGSLYCETVAGPFQMPGYLIEDHLDIHSCQEAIDWAARERGDSRLFTIAARLSAHAYVTLRIVPCPWEYDTIRVYLYHAQ